MTKRSASFLVRSLSDQHYAKGAGQDVQVKPRRPVADVERVVRDSLFKRRIAAAADLPEAGQTGQSFGIHVQLIVLVEIGIRERSRTDQAHFADQHVPQLRQLVETRATEN